MMQGVVERGTGDAVKAVGKPIAGKTGTTNDFRDAWFRGLQPDLAAGVYVGYDEPDSLGKDETGGHVAAPIFRDFMIDALKDTPAVDFRIPPGLRLIASTPRPACRSAGERAGDLPGLQARHRTGQEPQSGVRGEFEFRRGGRSAGRLRQRSASSDPEMPTPGPAAAMPDRPRAAARGHRRAAQTVAGRRPAANSAMLPPRGAPAGGTGGLYYEFSSEPNERSGNMRAEIEAAADDIRKSLALLRRHL